VDGCVAVPHLYSNPPAGYPGLLQRGELDIAAVLAASPYSRDAHYEDFFFAPPIMTFATVHFTNRRSVVGVWGAFSAPCRPPG